ncbi:MAG: hypothetical protein FJ217_16585 [Ignavibacteria bacterium]|nr:hypothetical protein [Ignavibacteria bacterium]
MLQKAEGIVVLWAKTQALEKVPVVRDLALSVLKKGAEFPFLEGLELCKGIPFVQLQEEK